MSDDLVSEEMEEEMEEDIASELPCTLAIEDSTQDSNQLNTDQVRFPTFPRFCVFVVKSLLEEDLKFRFGVPHLCL